MYLEHMLDAINRALEYTEPGEAQFRSDLKTQDAVLRNLETLGEAAKKLNRRTRALSADTPWREIAGFRDVIAHDYLEVDLDLVWNVIESDLPGLRETVIDLLGRVDT